MIFKETTLEANAFEGVSTKVGESSLSGTKLSDLIPGFLRHAQFDRSMSPQTIQKYGEALNWVIRHLGDLQVRQLDLGYITILKQKIVNRGAGESRVSSSIFALKSFLRYCKEVLELPVLDYTKVKSPKRPRRDVIYLTNEEVEQFVGSIKFENNWSGKNHKRCIRMDGLRFRVLVEVLLGTGMRLAEALSLNRDMIDLQKKEAKIVGKGNKERVVFFSDRALHWIKFYLDQRNDEAKPLFITRSLNRLSRADISKTFRGYAKKSGVSKIITPRILRHTVGTNLLFNGCPIGHIKEILGHERLETTCRFYLGLDRDKAREAHYKFLNY